MKVANRLRSPGSFYPKCPRWASSPPDPHVTNAVFSSVACVGTALDVDQPLIAAAKLDGDAQVAQIGRDLPQRMRFGHTAPTSHPTSSGQSSSLTFTKRRSSQVDDDAAVSPRRHAQVDDLLPAVEPSAGLKGVDGLHDRLF